MTARFTDHLLGADIHTNRPAANAVPTGTLYSCTTHGLIYKSDGATWVTWATLGGASVSPGRALLKEVVLAAAAATIDFTSSDIPTSGYKHLELRLMGRSTKAGVDQDIYLYANSDTTAANYTAQRIAATNTTLSGVSLAGGTIGYVPGASGAAGYAGLVRVDLPNFLDATFYQNGWHQSWTPNEPYTTLGPWTWKNAAAITALSLAAPSGSFVAGSIAQLYGVI